MVRPRENVLVTGATGFVGMHLVRLLTEQPDLRVFSVSRNGGVIGDLSVDALDLTSAAALREWAHEKPRFEAVFHLAAVIPTTFDSSDAEDSLSANVAMTQNVVSLARDSGSVVVYASSSSVYGSRRRPPFCEDAVIEPENLYSLGKYFGELLLNAMRIEKGLTSASLRLSAPYGPGQLSPTVVNLFLRAARVSEDLIVQGTGERVQDFTYVGDIVRSMILAYRKRADGVFNIASGHPTSTLQLAQAALSAVPGTRSSIVFSGTPDPQEGYRGIPSVEKALATFAYESRTTLEEGLVASALAMQKG